MCGEPLAELFETTPLCKLQLFVEQFTIFEAAAPCIRAFMDEVKYSATIVCEYLNLAGLSMNDLRYFIQNNKSLKHLWLGSKEPVSLEQSTALSRAIRSVQLRCISIMRCRFENLERMLEGCARVDELQVRCEHNPECTAVAAFLSEPANVLIELCMEFYGNHFSFDLKQAIREISESLAGNTRLKLLVVEGLHGNPSLGKSY
jgi:hypothetical protein